MSYIVDCNTLEDLLVSRAADLGVKQVVEVVRFSAGLSSQSYRVDVVTDSGPVTWVMRREPEFGVIPPYDIASEAGLLRAAAAADVPVPEVLYVEEDASLLPGRFMLMEFVEGEIYRSQDSGLAADADLVKALQDDFVAVLARVHHIRQDVLPMPADSREAARAHVAECRKRMHDTQVMPHPILEDALDVLHDLAPIGAPLVLCHGDFRLPNLKWRDRRIVGVLDWELARVADPMADPAFT